MDEVYIAKENLSRRNQQHAPSTGKFRLPEADSRRTEEVIGIVGN